MRPVRERSFPLANPPEEPHFNDPTLLLIQPREVRHCVVCAQALVGSAFGGQQERPVSEFDPESAPRLAAPWPRA